MPWVSCWGSLRSICIACCGSPGASKTCSLMTRNCTAHTCREGHEIRLDLHHGAGKLAINYQRDGHVVFGLGVRGNVKLLHPGAEHARHILERPAQEVRAWPSHLCRHQHISPGEKQSQLVWQRIRALTELNLPIDSTTPISPVEMQATQHAIGLPCGRRDVRQDLPVRTS